MLSGRQMALSKSPSPSTPAWSWGNALGCVAKIALCSHTTVLCMATLATCERGDSPFGLNWAQKKLQLACRQLGYLHVYIIWAVCDCRVPLFYLIICLEASPDLIMPGVVSLTLSNAPSGIAWAASSVRTLSHDWANRHWHGVSGFLRLRRLLGCY